MPRNEPIRLILARHGNTFEAGETPTQVGAHTDLPLTSQGRNQAQRIADYLAAEKNSPAAIYAGTLKRQIESAEIITKSLLVKSQMHLGELSLTEIDYGLWEGLTSDEITARWPKEYANWTEASEWAEGIFGGSLHNHLQNIKQWLAMLRKTYAQGDTIVGLTSNGVIRLFYSFEDKVWHRLQKSRQMEKLKVKTGHFCELLLFPDSVKIKGWNLSPS